MSTPKLARLDNILGYTTQVRDKTLRTFRLRCKHLTLAEERGSPPFRICMRCGAIERGWDCGYQVLVLRSESTATTQPDRHVISFISDRHSLSVFKQSWPMYWVGQSHENFGKYWDYKSLTAIPLPGKKTQ